MRACDAGDGRRAGVDRSVRASAVSRTESAPRRIRSGQRRGVRGVDPVLRLRRQPAAGRPHGRRLDRRASPIDPFHFAPRAAVPTLLLIGRDDWLSSPSDAERLLGLLPVDKRLTFYDAGHKLPPQFVKDAASWLVARLRPAVSRRHPCCRTGPGGRSSRARPRQSRSAPTSAAPVAARQARRTRASSRGWVAGTTRRSAGRRLR